MYLATLKARRLPGGDELVFPTNTAANERPAAAAEQEIPDACQCDEPCGCPRG